MARPDALNPTAATSALMGKIRGKDTGPELSVRALLWAMNQRGYRLHRRDILGQPDIAFVGRKIAIFVHGCFWHRHSCKVGERYPKKNQKFWAEKFERNTARDAEQIRHLRGLGWRVLVVWECELADLDSVADRLREFMACPN